MSLKKKPDKKQLSDYELDLIAAKQIRNKLFSQLNFGQLNNWREVYLLAGLSNGEIQYAYHSSYPDYSYDGTATNRVDHELVKLATKPTREELNHYCDCLLLRVEQREWTREYDKARDLLNPREQSQGNFSEDSKEQGGNNPLLQGSVSKLSNYTEDSKHPLQTAKLWKKQKEASAKLWEGIVEHKKKGQLLQAGTGSGKTFTLGELVRHLVDEEFIEQNKCFAPWPIIYVTKASIVAQTERVLRCYVLPSVRSLLSGPLR